MNKSIEIIAMVYKSVGYFNLVIEEFLGDSFKVDGWDIGLKIVANDPTLDIEQRINILAKLKGSKIKVDIYRDSKPQDYYLNRVYRCWNYAGLSSQYDNICFVNSDMVFNKDWLKNLLKHHNGTNIPCSRLIESGKLLSGAYAISKDCGRRPQLVNRELFFKICTEESKEIIAPSGLFMPCVFEKKRFVESGMYPEGNIYQDGVGTLNGFLESGDAWYFRKLESLFGMKHITVFDSLVYHIQEGEKDE